ncbi:hypothetical protein Pcinc_006391 [Petrolisthes cinctipes]|uniref:DNA-directed RNA polymerase n=1 Tax=Petrolisthes cinctipes TaxID=88211 RepID=A0AAE1KZM1_PETCI|nr:hypothetical protein Pcinc_006391 [Petrolisthes cinctipes]KAK3889629.1 hypothetical protein Pcinc_006391 [Petrolisthes cinctipes]
MEEEENEEKEEEEESLSELISDTQSYITSEQARTILRECWKKDRDILTCVYPILASFNQEYPTDMFFTSLLLVMPARMRPCNYLNGVLIEHETSTILKSIIRLSKALTFLMSIVNGTITDIPDTLRYILSEVPGGTNVEKVQTVWHQLQSLVDSLFDADLNKLVKNTSRGIRQVIEKKEGLFRSNLMGKRVIEKKEGLFRSNLMGKRVNYSARSVAAPDPQLSVDEVGVPMDFAIKLSYPVPVTQWNVEELRQMVINGPDVYPGAVMVEDEEGKKKRLGTMDHTQREAIAKKLLTPQESHVKPTNATKIVYRHLLSGDFVLMNRQPTLHKPSIQAHRARVMPKDRVLRMPYANCKAYNADFDGDELNLHFPQNEIARSEARHLITTHNQYLTPKDGSPLAGLIQDCVVASVMLTVRDRFFTREDYQQLVITGLSHLTGRIKTLPPAILKPKQLWTGKQVISTLLINIIPEGTVLPTFTFKTSVRVDLWQKESKREWLGGGEGERRREAMTDSEFVMHDGQLLCGVVDKSAIGSTSHGLIHVFYDQKLEVVRKLEKGISVARITEEYGISKQSVSDIKKAKDKLKHYAASFCVDAVSSKSGKVKPRKYMRTGSNSQLDSALMKWFVQMKSNGHLVRGVEILAAAKKLTESLGDPNFKGTVVMGGCGGSVIATDYLMWWPMARLQVLTPQQLTLFG